MSTFGAKFEQMRTSRGFSRSSIAKAADVHESTIFRLERSGRAPIRPETAYRLFVILNNRSPLTPEETRDFTAATGIAAEVAAVAARAAETVEAFGNLAHPAATIANRMQAPPSKDPRPRIDAAVTAIVDQLSAERAAALFELLANLSKPRTEIAALRSVVEQPGAQFNVYTPTNPPSQSRKPAIKRKA